MKKAIYLACAIILVAVVMLIATIAGTNVPVLPFINTVKYLFWAGMIIATVAVVKYEPEF